MGDTLSDLRRKISDLHGIYDWSFRIYLQSGKELVHEDIMLTQYNIHDGDSLHIKFKQYGFFDIWKNQTTTVIINKSDGNSIEIPHVAPTDTVRFI